MAIWSSSSRSFRAIMMAIEISFPEDDLIHEQASYSKIVDNFDMRNLSEADQARVRVFVENDLTQAIESIVDPNAKREHVDHLLHEAELLRIALREFPRDFDWRTAE